jgi:hypothetical protein
MVEFQIEGDINIAGSRILVPVAIATVLPGAAIPISTVLSPIPIAGTISIGSVVVGEGFIGTVGNLGTVGTLQSQANIAVASAVGSILSPVIVGSGTLVYVATVGYIGTIGTLQAGGGGGGGGGGGFATVNQEYVQSSLMAGTTFSGSIAGTYVAQSVQDLVVDYSFGTVAGTGSAQVSVVGVEPQTGKQTSVIVSGNVLNAPLGPTVQRIQAAGPVGGLVAVVVNTTTSTVGNATVGPAYVTVEQSFSQ